MRRTAVDDLQASGVILLANTHGRYLGDPDDAALSGELDRRETVVFIHPSEIVGPPAPDVAPFAAVFLLDTSRAAYRLVRNGFVRKYPHLKIILSHAGGFVPYASYRMAGAIGGDALLAVRGERSSRVTVAASCRRMPRCGLPSAARAIAARAPGPGRTRRGRSVPR